MKINDKEVKVLPLKNKHALKIMATVEPIENDVEKAIAVLDQIAGKQYVEPKLEIVEDEYVIGGEAVDIESLMKIVEMIFDATFPNAKKEVEGKA